MKLPRVSITGIMVAAIVIALDCAAIRSIRSRPDGLTGNLLEMLLCTIPMANAVAVGIAVMIRRRGRGRPFLGGFVMGGVMASAVVVGCGVWRMEWLGSYLEMSVSLISRVIGWDIEAAGEIFALVCLLPALLILPQFLVAFACGCASSRLANRSPEIPESWPENHRLGHVSLASLLIIAATPTLALEAYFRWNLDPLIARFGVNSRAIVDFYKMGAPGSTSTGPLPRTFGQSQPGLADGTAVRVEADDEPSVIQQWAIWEENQISETRISDFRQVRVTLLDGSATGQERSVPYYLLRPIR